ncbi:hypothetical protein M0812_15451 [Anaeramoeba flamelloides]|uniref:Uncharacterized protein n=1 Tax=Anaeramoeba flamelloides TaxID=1746091 RepID=A0AAV7ZG56_9EUKA|nr:hypothetical protein M0812_15451 [Anaeramoeba flamelloides]
MKQQNSFFSFQKLESPLKSIARNSIDLDNDLEEDKIFHQPNNVNLQRQLNKRLSQTIDFAYQSRNIETNKKSKLSMCLQKGNNTNQRIDPNKNTKNKKRSILKVSELLKNSNNQPKTKENRFLETKIQNKPHSQKGVYQKKNSQVPISSKKLFNLNNNNNNKKNLNNPNQVLNDSLKQHKTTSLSFKERSDSGNVNTKEEEINKKEKENTNSDLEENDKGHEYSKGYEEEKEKEDEKDEEKEKEKDEDEKEEEEEDDDDYEYYEDYFDDDDEDEDEEDAELLNCILQNSYKNHENHRIQTEEKKITIELLEKSLKNNQIEKPIFKIVKHRNAKTTIPMIEQLLLNPFLFDDEKEFQQIKSKRIESLIQKFYQKTPDQATQIKTPTDNGNNRPTQILNNQDPNDKFELLNQQNSNSNNIPTNKTPTTSTQNEENKLIKSQENLNKFENSPLKIGHEQWNKYVKSRKIQKNIQNAIPNIQEFIEITGICNDEFLNTDLEESRKILSNN